MTAPPAAPAQTALGRALAPLLRWLAPMPARGEGRIAVDPGDIGGAT